MPRQLQRRRFAQLGAIALLGFAGCGSPGEEEGEDGDGENGGGDDGEGDGGGEEEDALAPDNR
ncbi:hypothetical protein ACFR9U_13880 [Halorientalis brevis]|uniref:Uncharacterized protein n=1 Tax=Halorientalis brevis TaxID=1126241 RepID=A0ABD6CDJ3_9EURY|nr:hypothetical protein [Halorientalis brevis]